MMKRLIKKAVMGTLVCENFTENVILSVTFTDNEGIQEYNRQMREIDSPTDVLSFPGLFFEMPSEFYIEPGEEMDYTNPESGKVILGDIIISVDKVLEQALEYGHSHKREFAFLVAHSMYHLCGYDHMTKEEADIMEKKQEAVLEKLGITRDID